MSEAAGDPYFGVMMEKDAQSGSAQITSGSIGGPSEN